MNRIALIGEKSIEYIDRLINIWNSGNCAVLIDWRIPLHTVVEMMQEAEVHTCYIEKTLMFSQHAHVVLHVARNLLMRKT